MDTTKYLSYVLMVAAMATFYAIAVRAADEALPPVQQQGTISYVSGGIGQDESAALEAVQHNYNLRITSADKTGHFFGDTHVVVSDMHQHALLDTTGGPLFYATMPNGRYVVEGFSDNGQISKQTVTIANGKPARVHFSWNQEIADTTNY
jgi:hypothetical protein